MRKGLLVLLLCAAPVAGSYLIPDASPRIIPVAGATSKDWNPQSFWYYPWGRSGTHKGIDIFAPKGTPVLASTHGFIWSTGFDSMGGNYVLMLGSQWQFHYYAHLDTTNAHTGQWVKAGDRLGTVGDSGNAKGKPPHLHYQINNVLPRRLPTDANLPNGTIKAFYTNPQDFLKTAKTHAIKP